MQPKAEAERLIVTPQRAQQILDIGNTKFWELVKTGKIKMVEVGRRRMVVYSSLEALVNPEAEIVKGEDGSRSASVAAAKDDVDGVAMGFRLLG